jgi:hypothetical protein
MMICILQSVNAFGNVKNTADRYDEGRMDIIWSECKACGVDEKWNGRNVVIFNLQCISNPSLRFPSLTANESNGSTRRSSRKNAGLGDRCSFGRDNSTWASSSPGVEDFLLDLCTGPSGVRPFSRRVLSALVLVLCDHVFNLNLPLYCAGSCGMTPITTSSTPVIACRFCLRR